MIHKKLVQEKIKDYQIQNFVKESLKGVGLSSTKLQVTPLGEKIVVRAARPGLVVGRKGQSIKKLTNMLKKKFGLENPQIEIDEVKDTKQDPAIMAETIASYLERFGSARFKSIGHRCLEDAMKDGAYGAEILITGKVPSSRSKSWRFYKGYLKKCGDLSITGVKKAYATANLKTGSIGIQVRVMPSDIRLPDKVEILDQPVTEVEDVTASQETVEEETKSEKEESGKKETKTTKKTESKESGKASENKKSTGKKTTTKKTTKKKTDGKATTKKTTTTKKSTAKKSTKKSTGKSEK